MHLVIIKTQFLQHYCLFVWNLTVFKALKQHFTWFSQQRYEGHNTYFILHSMDEEDNM